MRPNFVLVEGHENHDHLYEKFKEDYMNSDLKVREIEKKHGISHYMYRKLRQEVVEKTGYKRPHYKFHGKNSDKERYIRKNISGTFSVQKATNGRTLYFGTYPNFEIARHVRDFFVENNWDISKLPEIREKYPLNVESEFTEYDNFSADYLQGIKSISLIEKYDLTYTQFRKLSSKVKKEHGLSRKPMSVSI